MESFLLIAIGITIISFISIALTKSAPIPSLESPPLATLTSEKEEQAHESSIEHQDAHLLDLQEQINTEIEEETPDEKLSLMEVS